MSKRADDSDLSFDEFDELRNPGPEVTGFDQVLDKAISRRRLLGGALAFGSTAILASSAALVAGPAAASSRIGFEAIPANTLDTVTLPKLNCWPSWTLNVTK